MRSGESKILTGSKRSGESKRSVDKKAKEEIRSSDNQAKIMMK